MSPKIKASLDSTEPFVLILDIGITIAHLRIPARLGRLLLDAKVGNIVKINNLTILTRALAGALIFGLPGASLSNFADAQNASEIAAQRIILRPRASVPEETLRGLISRAGALEDGSIPQLSVRFLKVPAHARDAVVRALEHNPAIELVEPDQVIPAALAPNDPYYVSNMEWHLPKIGAPEAWTLTTGSSTIVMAILDSGVENSHPDLSGKIVSGWNVMDNNSDTSDLHGHGTAVAGQAAAIGNNGVGVAGLAWGCRLLPIRVADSNANTTTSLIASGLVYAADHGARVANISFDVAWSIVLLESEKYFYSKGGVITVAAGNSSRFESSGDNPYILAISATDQNDALATFSNTGNNIDLAAPGVNILTTYLQGTYASGTGTSASAPLVAAASALILSVNPALTPADVQNILKQTADDLGAPGWDPSFGTGRLNVFRAVNMAVNAVPTPPADLSAPSSIISSPVSDSILCGVVNVNIAASDNVGVSKLELYLDGVLSGSSSLSSSTLR